MSEVLLSVPPHLRAYLHSAAGRPILRQRLPELADNQVFVGTDPAARRLGSGGGTVNLLFDAWQASAPAGSRSGLFAWLADRQRLVLHAGGESRRLPGYAGLSKIFLPMPAVAGLPTRRYDQMLMDFQIPTYRQTLREAGPKAAVLVTAGDVWLDFDPCQLPAAEADITGIGMRVPPAIAQHFGVFFVARMRSAGGPGSRPIAFFRQKPGPAAIRREAAAHDPFVDTGMWLLSVAALRVLFRRCGWQEGRQRFDTPDGRPAHLDLYTEVGNALGAGAEVPAALRRAGWSRLRTAVMPLKAARFYHLGSNRQLFDSFREIQREPVRPEQTFRMATPVAMAPPRGGRPVWLDGVAQTGLTFGGLNLVVGLPAGARLRRLARHWCVEVAPIGRDRWVFRPYDLDDSLRGAPGAGATICGREASSWLEQRGLSATGADVFDLPLYPVLRAAEIDQAMLAWFFAARPDWRLNGPMARHPRLSARQIPERTNFRRLWSERRAGQAQNLREEFDAWAHRRDPRVFDQDFTAIARFCRDQAPALGAQLRRRGAALVAADTRPEYAARWLHLLADLATGRERRARRQAARDRLQQAMLAASHLARARPRRALGAGRTAWARSPVRLDLAGGWTDTPPYCLEHGGAVLNVAVELEGRPPIQVFVRSIPEPLFRLRSLDLALAEEVRTFAALAACRHPAASFALAKAALALAGFHPDFHRGPPARSLRDQLRALGGGLEVALQSDVPKGSGLGTSSILAATILAALNRACGLRWQRVDLYRRVLAVEQMLTIGGGWQDQAGALFPGLKLVRTAVGPAQTPVVRALPGGAFPAGVAAGSILLYYTGITRLAKDILQEIVQDMASGRSGTRRTLGLIRANALALDRALRAREADALHRCVARSWDLNRRLDPGTTTPEIERILATAGPGLKAAKLLGAGGGGYLLMVAANPAAARRIQARLEADPPNQAARFTHFRVAQSPLKTTVSQ